MTGRELERTAPRAERIPLPSLEGLGLEGWKPSQWLPDHITMPTLDQAIATLSPSIVPAGDVEFAKEVRLLVEFGRTFNIEIESIAALTAFYKESLGDLPPDLLQKAFAAVRKSWHWGNRMPMPADVRKTVAAELSKRHHAKAMLKMAKWKLEQRAVRSDVPISEEARDRVAVILKQPARAKRMPIELTTSGTQASTPSARRERSRSSLALRSAPSGWRRSQVSRRVSSARCGSPFSSRQSARASQAVSSAGFWCRACT